MITLYDPTAEARKVSSGGAPLALPDGTLWIDLVDPSDDEDACVERAAGFALPSADQLNEIETSSRLVADGDVLMMSTPVVFREGDGLHTTPVGFVLGRDLLVTVRSRELKSFADYVAGKRGAGCSPSWPTRAATGSSPSTASASTSSGRTSRPWATTRPGSPTRWSSCSIPRSASSTSNRTEPSSCSPSRPSSASRRPSWSGSTA